MGSNGHVGMPSPQAVNPAHIVAVTDFSPDTLRSVIAHLEVSTEFEHLIYREAELDAIWSITGFFAANECDSRERDAIRRLHAGVHKAHDLVAENCPTAAAALLRTFL